MLPILCNPTVSRRVRSEAALSGLSGRKSRHDYVTIIIRSVDTGFMRPLSASFPYLSGML